MLIKPSMVELEIWDQCHFVMDGQGFPHYFFHIFWNPLSAPKLSLKLKMESENIYLKTCLLNLPWLSCRPKTNVILSWMDKANYYCPSVPQNSSVVICLKKKSLSPPLLLHHIFYVSTIHHGSNRTQDNNANVLWTGWWEYWKSGRGFRVESVLVCMRVVVVFEKWKRF